MGEAFLFLLAHLTLLMNSPHFILWFVHEAQGHKKFVQGLLSYAKGGRTIVYWLKGQSTFSLLWTSNVGPTYEILAGFLCRFTSYNISVFFYLIYLYILFSLFFYLTFALF